VRVVFLDSSRESLVSYPEGFKTIVYTVYSTVVTLSIFRAGIDQGS
jgi:hypothetical protein